jgi:DNA ligase-associated metallophosphoesterase
MIDCEITLKDTPALLTPERALFLPRARALIVADVHLGKDSAFRAGGIPVPRGATDDSLERLSRAIERKAAKRLVFLGDLVHSRSGLDQKTLEAVAAWRSRHAAIEMILIPGNHDLRSGGLPHDWRIDMETEELIEDPFVFRHQPAGSPHGYTIAGHIHPAVQLVGPGRQKERIACFIFGEEFGILPAFGTFTGTYLVKPQSGDRVFAVTQDEIVEVKE